MTKIEIDMANEKDGHQQKYPPDLFVEILDSQGGEATTTEITDLNSARSICHA